MSTQTPKRILILSSRVGSGHVAAAAALERIFRRLPGLEVCNMDAMDYSTWLHDLTYSGLYFPMSRIAPWLMEWGYRAHHRPFATEPTLPTWDRLNAVRLTRRILEYRPDLTICTHFMPANLVGHLVATGRLTTSLSVVTTDYDVHGIWLGRTFSRYFVALEEARAHCCALGLPEERISVSGIPVDPVFEEPFDRSAALARHGLQPELPAVLVSAGTTGNSAIRQVIEQLHHVRRPIQVVVVCGRNQRLRRMIEALVADNQRFRVLGFSEEMPDLIRLSSLFIGKPGGLTAAECMAGGLPMLIIDPLPGQEERNSHHLLEEGVAMRCDDMTTIAYKVDRILGEPGLLAQMRSRARAFGRPDAARTLADVVLSDQSAPIQLSRTQRQQMIAVATGQTAAPAHIRRRSV
jgi:processive 1,2-diacylglycerol beta-glucosyltransferase